MYNAFNMEEKKYRILKVEEFMDGETVSPDDINPVPYKRMVTVENDDGTVETVMKENPQSEKSFHSSPDADGDHSTGDFL